MLETKWVGDKFKMLGFPVTSSKSHFIFWVTSYQREKRSCHTNHFLPVHFIPCVTTYKESLHTECDFIPCCTSYQSYLISVSSSRSLNTSSLHNKVTLSLALQLNHFISSTTYHSLWSIAYKISIKLLIILCQISSKAGSWYKPFWPTLSIRLPLSDFK